jgi:hypothetical protein
LGVGLKKERFLLIESNIVHLIAGDAHQADGERGPCLHLVKPVLEKMVGKEKTQVLLNDNPRRFWQGKRYDWGAGKTKDRFYRVFKSHTWEIIGYGSYYRTFLNSDDRNNNDKMDYFTPARSELTAKKAVMPPTSIKNGS